MRMASLVLGIVGGIIAVVFGLFLLTGGIVFASIMPRLQIENTTKEFYEKNDIEYDEAEMINEGKFAGFIFGIAGGANLLAGALSIIGAALVKKKNVLSGIFMLVGAGMCFFAFLNFFAAILLILGGIFALGNDRNSVINNNAT